MIHNMSHCLLTAGDLQTFPGIHGNTELDFATPHMYIPTHLDLATPQELRILQEALPQEVTRLDHLASLPVAPKHMMDLSSLLHTNDAVTHQRTTSYWYFVSLLILYAMIVFPLSFYFLRCYFHRTFTTCFTQ
jgi:hypothetical protein